MSYLRYWKMASSPFQRNAFNPWFFASYAIEEALARVQFLASHARRFGLVVGTTGVGRTTLLRQLPRFLARAEYSTPLEVISLYCPSIDSLPRKLSHSLSGNIHPSNRGRLSASPRSSLEDALVALKSQSQHLLVLIDDLHLSSPRFQADLSWLIRVEAPITILASLQESEWRSLDPYLIDRCELRIDLAPWNLEETAEFFEEALEAAGGADDLFDAQSIVRIQELSRGNPRRICQIAELSLVAGAVQRAERITSGIVDEAVLELPANSGAAFRSTDEFAA